jgi:hypothetical protein
MALDEMIRGGAVILLFGVHRGSMFIVFIVFLILAPLS